jgi:hypothetical protein
MSKLNKYQVDRLEKAATRVDPEAVQTILRLRELLRSKEEADHTRFRDLFAKFYGLNSGGLSKEFKQRYFELLFEFDSQQADVYTPLLSELYNYRRRKGGYALQVSFVSKLVATHDDSYPMYDRHVRNFFGLSAPGGGSIEFRIAGFVENLAQLRATYLAWIDDPRWQAVFAQVSEKIPAVDVLHPVRVCDLLVWTVGANEIE